METAQPLEFSDITVVSWGPLRAAVRAEVKYGQSSISLTVRALHIDVYVKSSNEDASKISLDATTGKSLFFLHRLCLSVFINSSLQLLSRRTLDRSSTSKLLLTGTSVTSSLNVGGCIDLQ